MNTNEYSGSESEMKTKRYKASAVSVCVVNWKEFKQSLKYRVRAMVGIKRITRLVNILYMFYSICI